MRILVTGAAGFIGSHLVESLVKEGNEVVSFVRVGKDVSSLADLDTEIVYGDLSNKETLKHATKGLDVVYHLAAIPNWQGRMSREQYWAVNVEGTWNVCEACRVNGVRRVLFTSSLEAVGPSMDGNPVKEETIANPRNIYGETKLEGERIVRQYYKRYGLETVIVRLPMVYGPRNMLHLKRYFRMVKRGYYPVISTGSALMEFCYINNTVHGLKLAMNKGRPGEIYFISDERSYQFREVLLEIARELDVNLRLLRVPIAVAKGLGLFVEVMSKVLKFYPFIFKETGRPAFSRSSVAWMARSILFCDISKAKRELGYKAPYTLREGIHETAEWYRRMGVL